MQSKLENIISWLTKLWMVVNEAKTDLCLFHARDAAPISVNINGVSILSKKTINILCFNGLLWSQ